MQNLAYIGQFLGGIGFIITAIMAVLTYYGFQKRQLDEQSRNYKWQSEEHSKKLDDEWLDRFRDLYREFWKDDEIMIARYYVNNEDGYKKLEPILIKRNGMKDCNVDWEEYQILEKIDKFCSVLARIRSFGKSIAMTPVQEELWGDLLYNFWIKKLRGREELTKYVSMHWSKIHDDVNVVRRESHIRQ